NTASDADLPANTLTFSLVSAPGGVTLDPSSGVLTWTPTEAQGPSTNLITVRVTDNGAPQLSDTKSFTVVVTEANSAPVLSAIGDQIAIARTQLTFTNSATRSEVPPEAIDFSLVSAPGGVTLDPSSGVLTRTPTEAEGPSTNLITVKVTDNGAPELSDTKSFTVVVTEANSAPVLSAIGDQIAFAGAQLTLTNSATDGDVPANMLTYSLDPSAPAGAFIDPENGLFTWTPATNQVPGTNVITVRVMD